MILVSSPEARHDSLALLRTTSYKEKQGSSFAEPAVSEDHLHRNVGWLAPPREVSSGSCLRDVMNLLLSAGRAEMSRSRCDWVCDESIASRIWHFDRHKRGRLHPGPVAL